MLILLQQNGGAICHCYGKNTVFTFAAVEAATTTSLQWNRHISSGICTDDAQFVFIVDKMEAGGGWSNTQKNMELN